MMLTACRWQIIPIVQFSDIKGGTVPDSVKEGVQRTGVVVIRGVMPKDQTEALLQDARDYFAQHKFNGFPSNADKKVSRCRPVRRDLS
jgi:thiamine monophosphate synthase